MNTELQKLIYDMMTENTGKHFLDSGGANGRHWQRNRKKTIEDFINEDEFIFEVDVKTNEVLRTTNLFHYLSGSGSNLTLDSICKKFNAMQNDVENNGEYYGWNEELEVYGVYKSAVEFLIEYGMEYKNSYYTYNDESDLSQNIQVVELSINDESYILLQTHNGCDARGGMSDAKLFHVSNYGEWMINQYMMPYWDCYQVNEELEYIDKMIDYWNPNIIYEGAKLDTIKENILNS